MKNWKLKFLVVSVACVLAVVAVKYLPALLCGGGESEVYHRYEHRDDLKVGFVKDYRVDDSTTVDVTTLTAKDSAGWEALLREMNVSDLIIEICNKAAKKGNYTVAFYNCKKNHPEQHTEIDIPNTDFVLYSYKEYTLYVFDITSRKQRNAIQTQRIKETFNN